MGRARLRASGPARLTALAVALVLALAGCGGSADAEPLTATTLTRPYQVPDVTLTSSEGRPFDVDTDATAPLTVAYFGYTRCDDICPAVLTNLASAMTRLDDADRARVQVLFLTSDPEHDTPAVLHRYLARFDPSFLGLSGTFAQMESVARPLAVGLDEVNAGAHTTSALALVGGQAVAYWDDTVSPSQYAADLHTMLTQIPQPVPVNGAAS